MVFKADSLGADDRRIEKARHQAAPLFLRRESFCQQIQTAWSQPGPGFVVVQNGVWFSGASLWPVHQAPIEMARINQRDRSFLRILAKEGLQPKVHDSPR